MFISGNLNNRTGMPPILASGSLAVCVCRSKALRPHLTEGLPFQWRLNESFLKNDWADSHLLCLKIKQAAKVFLSAAWLSVFQILGFATPSRDGFAFYEVVL